DFADLALFLETPPKQFTKYNEKSFSKSEDRADYVLYLINQSLEKVREIGDTVPLFLVHKSERKVMVLYKKKNGESVNINLELNAKKEWHETIETTEEGIK